MSSSFKPEQARVPSALPLPAPPLTKFNIGLCQLSVTTDKKRNISHAKNAIEEAASKGAKIVLLPVYAEDIDAGGDASPSIAMLSEVSKRLKITIIGGSIPERFGDCLYNTCCVFGSDGELKAKHRKIHLFDIDIPGKITFMESRTLTAGETPTIVDTDVGRIGIGICYDIRFQELAMIYAARGAHLLCYPGAFNMTTGPLHWELLQRARATDSQLYVATCSPARDSGAGYTAWGHTTLVGPIHLFDIDIPGKITFMESKTLTAGETPTIVDTDVERIGIGICYDIRFQELAMIYAARGKAMAKYLTPLHLVAPEIPLDLQIEILKRLPSKSLMRFKCVSKLWSFLIRSRYFSKLYRTAVIPPRQPCVYMSLVEHVDDCDSMEVCQNPGKSRLLALSSSNSADESLEPFLTIQGMGGHKMVSLRGLILYTVCRKACIYNPATRQCVTLPAVKSIIFAQVESPNKYVHYFLGHDPVLDQYKVVCNVVTFSEEESDSFENLTSEHWVFILEAGFSWKKIEFDQPAHVSTSPGLCINGVIYYLACTSTAWEIVISFDVRSEEFKMIQAPQLGECKGFIEYDGKPTIFDHTYIRQNGLVDLWVLEDDGGKWSKKSLVLQASQMHLLKDESIEDLDVECRTQKGEIILVPKPFHYFLYYDIQKNDLRKVNVNGISGHYGLRFSFRHMDQNESIMHLEI